MRELTITISGKSGSGKTFILNIIAKTLFDLGFAIDATDESDEKYPVKINVEKIKKSPFYGMDKTNIIIRTKNT